MTQCGLVADGIVWMTLENGKEVFACLGLSTTHKRVQREEVGSRLQCGLNNLMRSLKTTVLRGTVVQEMDIDIHGAPIKNHGSDAGGFFEYQFVQIFAARLVLIRIATGVLTEV